MSGGNRQTSRHATTARDLFDLPAEATPPRRTFLALRVRRRGLFFSGSVERAVAKFFACSPELGGQTARESAYRYESISVPHVPEHEAADVPNPRKAFTFAGKENARRC